MTCFLAVAYDVSPASPAQPRVAALLRELVGRGHDVELWTAREPGAWARNLDAERLTVRVIADPVGRVYERFVARPSPPAEGVARGASESPRPACCAGALRRFARGVQQRLLFPDPERVWSARVARRVGRRARDNEVAITFSRPESVGLVGRAVQRRNGRWWLDFADGWCFAGHRAEATAPGPRRDRELALEREWVGAADAVSTVNQELADWFAKHRTDEVVLFPNIVPDELVVELSGPGPVRPSSGQSAGAERTLTFAHLGRLSKSDPLTTLGPLVDVLRRDADEDADTPRLRFLFYGDYSASDRAGLADLSELGHEVIVREPVPRAELARESDSFDAGLLMLAATQRGSSSKLLDFLGLGLPVFAVASPQSLAAEIVTAAGCGEIAPGDDPARAWESWRAFVDGLATGRFVVDPDVRARYTSAVCVPPVADRLLQLVPREDPPTS